MARDIEFRLSLKDGEIFRRTLLQLGEDGQKALARIEKQGAPTSRALMAINSASREVQGSVAGFTARLGPAGAALSALGPAGFAAGTAVAVLGGALVSGIRDAEEAAQSHRRLEAVMRATGHSAGLTADEISAFADEMERTRLVTAEAVKDVASVMATFRSVTGSTFMDSIRLAQDMSTVFGQDLRSSATQLGKALEDPVNGITALRRVGVSFSNSQKEMIGTLVESGRTLEAQRIIIEALQKQIGGAGEAEMGGLTGAYHRLTSAIGNMTENLGGTWAGQYAASFLRGWAQIAEGAADATGPTDNLAGATARLAAAEQRLAEVRKLVGANPVSIHRTALLEAQAEVEQARREVERHTAAEQSDRDRARAGQQSAEQERNAEAQKARIKALEEARVKAANDAADRIRDIRAKLDRDVDAAESRRGMLGIDPKDVDREVTLLRDVAARAIEDIQKPIDAARQRSLDQTRRALADMERELQAQIDPRGAAMASAASRLPAEATDADRARARELAAAIYDQKQAQDDLNRSLEREGELLAAARAAKEEYGIATGRVSKDLQEAYEAGMVDEDVYARAMQDAERKRLEASRSSADGIKLALMDIREAGRETAQSWRNDINAMNDVGKSFFLDITTGSRTAAEALNNLLSGIQRVLMSRFYDRAVGGIVDSFLGGFGIQGQAAADVASMDIFHEGGIVGSPTQRRLASRHAFLGAGRFHSGGLAGLRPGEVPVIAMARERIMTEAQQDNTAATIQGLARLAASGGPGRGEVVVNPTVVIRAPGVTAQTRATRGPGGEIQLDVIVEQIEQRMGENMARGRGIAPVVEQRYGVSPVAGNYR